VTITENQYNTVINGLRQQLELLRDNNREYRQKFQVSSEENLRTAKDLAETQRLCAERDQDLVRILSLLGEVCSTECGRFVQEQVKSLDSLREAPQEDQQTVLDFINGALDKVSNVVAQAAIQTICGLRKDNKALRARKRK